MVFKNSTRHQQQKQQRKGMIDMIFVLSWFKCVIVLSVYITAHLLFQNFSTVVCFDTKKFHSCLYLLGVFLIIKIYKANCRIFTELIAGMLFYCIGL